MAVGAPNLASCAQTIDDNERRTRNRNCRHRSRLAVLAPYFQSPSNRRPADARIVDGVARIAVAEVVLHGPQIGAAVGEIVAAGMAQGVRVDLG